ncbi:YitT family protein [Acholeplasma manati]|uniref:YitT family protein n=1 Tax=Paracholeplasma manati TaxID=591373 RepID=A0ABT2Y6Q8_9MOLU|nr:YitT family protein [Paracholeplasma manati]MCV2232426.1 YitT family protein [Paracholeplasma manati]
MIKKLAIEYAQIAFGVTIMTLGFYFFLLPENLVIGGVMGIAVIFKAQINPSIIVFILNTFLLFLGLIVLGKDFFMKTIFGSLASPVILFILETLGANDAWIMNQLTESKLLIAAVSGSILVGVGLGIVFRFGGTTGGMDVLQSIIHKKLHIPYQIIFYFTDGLVVLLSLVFFRDIELFIYAVASVFLISIIVDNVSIKGRAGQTIFVVTKKPDLIKQAIYDTIDRGCTLIDSEGGFSGHKGKMVICTMRNREVNKMRSVIERIDPESFTFMTDTKEAVGRGFSKE